MTDPRPLILFHAECVDGIVSAWVAWRRFFERADYVPVKYGRERPDCTDRLVYVLDFCYPPEETVHMADEASRVVILDHHATAIDRFKASWKERPDVEYVFDIERSGAGITSDYFNSSSRVEIVNYVEDRDLWRFKLPSSKEVNAAIAAACLGKTPIQAFQALNDLRGKSMKQLITQGEGARMQIDAYARQCAEAATRSIFADYEDIPIVNIARPMNSDVLHLLTKNALFAVGWYVDDDRVIFSLRTDKDDFDVARVAERYGGGGHKGAAGFTLGVEAIQYFVGK